MKELFAPDYDKEAREAVEDWHRKVEAIVAAWRTDAFQWYRRIFSAGAMDVLYQGHKELVERWVREALADSPAGLALRVRLGGLLEPICRVLLTRSPQLGQRLWQALRKRDSSSPLVFDTIDIAFSTNTNESHQARNIIADECWSDVSIAQLALACQRWKRQEWLDETVERLISAERLWMRAKGLTLASLSDITIERFEELVSKAAIERTWVERSLPALRLNVHKNSLARHWYRLFLASEDPDAAWGALQIVLAHADERLLCWSSEIEDECADRQLTDDRLRFLGLGWRRRRDLREKLGRDREREKRLFGLEIQPGEIIPFMSPIPRP